MNIYASKIYKGLSKDRQQHIRAAIDNPLNVELVTQLKSYLDEEYQEIAEPVKEVPVEIPEEVTDDNVENEESSDAVSKPSAPSFTPHKSFGDRVADTEEELGDLPDNTLEEMPEELPEESADEINESVNVNKTTITASIKDNVHEIKDTLNLSEDTAGVARVNYKDREVWVYYQDSVNLNNVMYETIERLNASGFVNLKFSRLARTDNAIVFDIDYIDTEDVIKPIDHEE